MDRKPGFYFFKSGDEDEWEIVNVSIYDNTPTFGRTRETCVWFFGLGDPFLISQVKGEWGDRIILPDEETEG